MADCGAFEKRCASMIFLQHNVSPVLANQEAAEPLAPPPTHTASETTGELFSMSSDKKKLTKKHADSRQVQQLCI